ncbi:hypothetical protein [Pseudoflavonifractor sp. 524-17]|uniref:hypothetical protein n=1 Tax=Pseudoflavonifractor sp. 524-17 TaxID=2304577 RepID=UPI00137957D1|nr:hypothetical protein [Pseudoflavonifractor sp. 524-17]
MNRCQARKLRLMKRWARAHTSFLIGLPLYLIALALLELLDLTSLPIPVTPIRHVQGFPYFD